MFIKEHWFWRGAQSAVFYYISCAPCTKLTYRRKRRKESQKAKAEKAMEEATSDPTFPYPDHPLPSGTNPYWKEEMTMGPGPPHKKRKKDDEGRLIEMQPGGSGVASSNGSKGTSSDTMDAGYGSMDVPHEARESEEGWNRRRYQREDEILWGLDVAVPDSTGMPRLSNTGGHGDYYYARNPAVNDLHPPVVSTAPRSRVETQWMLQPPPKARIMEGKERASRSRSVSGASNRSQGSSMRKGGVETGLGRQLSERLVESKMKRSDHSMSGALCATGMSRSRGSSNLSQRSNATTNPPAGQRHDRDRIVNTSSPNEVSSQTNESNQASNQMDRSKIPPIHVDTDVTDTSVHRPQLPTIPSSSLVPTFDKMRISRDRSAAPSHLSPQGHGKKASASNSTSSLNMLEDLDPDPHLRPKQNFQSKALGLMNPDGNQANVRPLPDDDSVPSEKGEREFSAPVTEGSSLDGIENRMPGTKNLLLDRDFSNLAIRPMIGAANTDPASDSEVGYGHRWSMDI